MTASEQRVERLRDRIRSIEEELTRITPILDAIPGGGAKDKIADGVSKMLDLQLDLIKAVIRRERELARIEFEIEALPAQQQTVIVARYIEHKGWNKIAREMHYDNDGGYVFKIHRAALKRLGNKSDTKRH